MYRSLLILVLVILSAGELNARKLLDSTPERSTVLEGYSDMSVVKKRMGSMPLHHIEGIWQLTGEGSTLAIERITGHEATTGRLAPDEEATPVYRMVVIRSTDISVAPGTVTGYLTPAAKERQYDARIYSSRSDDHVLLTSPTANVITLSDDGTRLSFHPYGRRLRFNWWRLLLPYMYRTLVTPLERPAGDIDGCVRLYPAPYPPLQPVYL